MVTYSDRPWLARYDHALPSDVTAEFGDALAMARATVAARPDDPAGAR